MKITLSDTETIKIVKATPNEDYLNLKRCCPP